MVEFTTEDFYFDVWTEFILWDQPRS